MIDKELADKVVALGVGYTSEDGYYALNKEMYDDLHQSYLLSAEEFTSDWRVAGALMEKVSCVGLAVLVNMSEWQAMAFPPDDCEAFEVINESAPRAIIEACVEALSG